MANRAADLTLGINIGSGARRADNIAPRWKKNFDRPRGSFEFLSISFLGDSGGASPVPKLSSCFWVGLPEGGTNRIEYGISHTGSSGGTSGIPASRNN